MRDIFIEQTKVFNTVKNVTSEISFCPELSTNNLFALT